MDVPLTSVGYLLIQWFDQQLRRKMAAEEMKNEIVQSPSSIELGYLLPQLFDQQLKLILVMADRVEAVSWKLNIYKFD